jgi:hypothetical protein
MKKYLFVFSVFLTLIAALIFLYLKTAESDDNLTWQIYLYFTILTILFHYGIVMSTRSRPQVFVRYYMAATTIKLLLNLGIIVVYSVLHRDMAVRFIITFMIMYFIFSIFEMIFVMRDIKK